MLLEHQGFHARITGFGHARDTSKSLPESVFVCDPLAEAPGTALIRNAAALGGIRTPNLLIRSQMLYPLSYERSGRRV